MRTLITTIFLCSFCLLGTFCPGYAQPVTVLAQSEFKTTAKPDIFKCITDQRDTTEGHYMATLQVRIGKKENSFTNGFVAIREHAMTMGANAFRLKAYDQTGSDQRTLTLDVYYFEDTKKIVRSAYQNKVYIFGDDRANGDKYDLKVNGEKVSFRSGTYLHYETRPKQKLKLDKGGFSGMQVTLEYAPEKLPTFLSMSGFGLEPGAAPGAIGFNTGRFTPINTNLGYLLIQCLTEAEHIEKE